METDVTKKEKRTAASIPNQERPRGMKMKNRKAKKKKNRAKKE